MSLDFQLIQPNVQGGMVTATLYSELQSTKRAGYKASQERNKSQTNHTSYTAFPDSSLLISPISTVVPFRGPYNPLLLVGSTSVSDIETLGLRNCRSRAKASLNVTDRWSVPSSCPPPPVSGPSSGVLPRRSLVKLTRRSFKSWTLTKTLKSNLASKLVEIHQEIKRAIIASTTPTGSLAHNSLLFKSASRLKAEVNAIVAQRSSA